MMNKNELHGTLVLVHPGLENDPAGQQGKVGILTYVDSSDEIFVSFDNNQTEGKYSPNALLQLKDRSELYPAMMEEAASMNLEDYKDLYKISLLQDRGRNIDIWNALEIAGNNPAIWSRSLVPVENSIPLKMDQFVGR
ncbi:hypothetical protein [Mucilaginibacter lappiensis]